MLTTAEATGSVLMTAEQRNWQFMSLFVKESMGMELPPVEHGPRDSKRMHEARLFCYSVWSSNLYRRSILFVIVLSLIPMLMGLSTVDNDGSGELDELLLRVDEMAQSRWCGSGWTVRLMVDRGPGRNVCHVWRSG